jgi:DNA-binding NarL/FixJ family response regulator
MAVAAKPIKVLIIDDHAVVRLGLRTLLEREDHIQVTIVQPMQ